MDRHAASWSRVLRSPVVLRSLAYSAGGLLLLCLAALAGIYVAVRGSLPQIEGEIRAPALQGNATIERDGSGRPTIRAGSRRDLALATGVAHAQDRFFQMDLMRRAAAGELAALLGPSLVDADRVLRRHRFRSIAAQVLDRSSPMERELLDAYAAGVNIVLDSATVRPWEYLLLRTRPDPWRSEDSLLVAFSMYLDLHESTGEAEIQRGYLRDALPADLFAFLHPVGTEWDAPIVGGAWRTPPIPGQNVVDLRGRKPNEERSSAFSFDAGRILPEETRAGSNAWAIAATHTADGKALLANDMHLGLRLPNVWYPARLIVEDDGREARDLAGVTLPGLPLLIVGSNGSVAWGYTNSYGDWTDMVVVEADADNPSRYLVGDGTEAFEVHRGLIEVNGGDPVEFEFNSTRWGPLVETDLDGRAIALAWTAHRAEATNLGMLAFETADSVETVLDRANRAGGPVQNFVAVDANGRIGWTLMGQVPLRGTYDSTVPASWRAGESGWLGWLAPEDYPRVIDPPAARLWSANARPIDAETWFRIAGDGGYDLGARAAQIRDSLLSGSAATAEDMAALQIDDRALFLTRWRDLLLEVLAAAEPLQDEQVMQARTLVQNWSGRASAEDRGYRIVRAFRNQVRNDVFESLIEPARLEFPDARFAPSAQFEGPLWRIVTERPMHLLSARYGSWQSALLESFAASLDEMLQSCTDLSECTWGQQNMLSIRHPLSSAVPFLSRWLDMPETAMNGDSAMPRVQGRAFGASQRLVVSPGREGEALFQMPGGPVGHPLSPFYGAGHEHWVRGESKPLWPGKAEYVLRVVPDAE